MHTLVELFLILFISELSYRFIENPMRKFQYKRYIQNGPRLVQQTNF